ncbi:prepilin peptidase [Pacificoceanicola onchidii]|uniref:prepilin peptidase n=1 Tax=Pacificoceanicola onchidii TaxID=2562685 RepID=UPI0010A375F7|nr:prepilin peptidase [Pacificoceanicola onchidii]
MHIPAFQAALFAVFVVPISILTFMVDMRTKKITNLTVWALFITFVVIGLATLPFMDFVWRFAHYAVIFAYGLLMWFFRQIGAGDVKFAAVLGLFIHPGDIRLMLFLGAAAMLAATVTVLLARWTPLHRLAPDWKTWKGSSADDATSVGKGNRFTIPMGTGFALMLSAYLVMGALYGQ